MDCSSGVKSSGGKIPSQSDLRGRVSTGTTHRLKKKAFRFATWNVRTLQDTNTSGHAERRTATVAHELKRLNIDIAALSETRFLDDGSLSDNQYTFFWKGLPAGSRKIHGVGFAIKDDLVPVLSELPRGISERLMTLTYQLPDKTYVTVISAYAPTLDSEPETKDAFYEQLENTLRHVPKQHRIILLGDFNARVGRQADLWPGIIGTNGIGNVNANGARLLSKCAEHNLVVTNTIFRQRNKYKGTWRHPRSGHWHLMDYIIVKKSQVAEVHITKAISYIENWTDHRLVLSEMSMKLQPRYREKVTRARTLRLNLEGLAAPEIRETLRQEIEEKSASLTINGDPETCWTQFRDMVYESSKATLGTTGSRKNPDWFTENHEDIKDILDAKHSAFQRLQNKPNDILAQNKYKQFKQQVQKQIRSIKNAWWSSKAKEIQEYADQHDQRNFYNAVKEAYGVTHRKACPIKDAHDNLLTEEGEIRARWKEHYSSILNMETNVDFEAIQSIPQYELDQLLNCEVSAEEIKLATSALKNHKAPGSDNIPAEIYKVLGNTTMEHLKAVFNQIWNTGVAPQDFRNAQIVNLFKNKGSASDCGNYRGISLLSTGGKILARVMASRLLKHMNLIIPESQCGFRPKRGTSDLIFTLRQLQEKVKEHQTQMYIAFIDLAKAFDSLNREALWAIMERFGVPKKFLQVCRSLHKNNLASVIHNGVPTEPFQTKTGVRQGCVLAPILFNIFAAALSMMVDSKLRTRGLEVRYRYDGGLFNLKRLRAKTRTKFITDLQYADDCGLISDSAENLQKILETYSWAYQALGLKINVNKTKIMCTPTNAIETAIVMDGNNLEYVEHFNYLGSIVNRSANIDDEVRNRINAASRSFWSLRERVFDNHDLSVQTKAAVYRAIVIPTMLYGCETWTPYRRHLKDLNQLQQRQLRQLMRIKWFHRISNETVLERAKCGSIETLASQARLRWAGHVYRMEENRLPKCVLYGELANGQRKHGGQLKRFKDVLHDTLKKARAQTTWEAQAAERSEWRRVVKNFSAEEHRNRRRSVPQENFECPDCGRIVSSRIGLFSHRRTHGVPIP